ncbi:MAG: orotidine-5'-phosphate decarboxylase [Candidatus Lokiarchaeota archaeon]|nr:orotidine-5'-phosphate decarboxylase [Candidatus Lokiarchaeota archaeon]
MSFVRNLMTLIKEKKSVVCMGLDPRLEGEGLIPSHLIDQYNDPIDTILNFNKELIDKTHELIPIIKPQIAFYEKYDALSALKETINYAHKKGLLVLLDSKRNDIGSTSEAYAYSNFRIFKADACTINAYLGIDGIKPFIQYKNKGKFILVKTSNPSSIDFQDLFSVGLDNISKEEFEIDIDKVDNNLKLKRNYVQMAELVQKWAKNLEKYDNYHNLGVVIGATFPNELKFLRKIINNSIILIPGYGAQGATAKDVKFGFDKDGLGAIVNSSRGITYAYAKNNDYPPEKFAEAAEYEIKKMNLEINKEINL